MLRARILSGGHGHDFGETTAALSEMLAARGGAVTIDTGFDACVERLDETDLLVVNALRWTMTQHEKYAPFRAALAYRPGPGSMDRLAGWVAGGGRLLAMHTAVICFDTEPGWLEVLGGGWRWGLSHHPPRGPLRIEPAGAAAFDLVDEAYHHMSPAPDAEVRATCALAEGPQPLAWTRRRGAGRVAVDTLGHDRRSLETPGHARLVGDLTDWLVEG
jgi:type 1 glutamine amidotransferase